MKHITLLLLFTLFLFSCKEIDELTHFSIEQETEFILDTTNLAGYFFNTTSAPLLTHADSIFRSNRTDASHVTQIIATSVLVKLSYTDTIPDFHFELANIYMLNAQGKQKLLAWNNTLTPEVLSPIPLLVSTDNLNDILSDTTVSYLFEGIVSQEKIPKTKWRINTTFYVNAIVID